MKKKNEKKKKMQPLYRANIAQLPVAHAHTQGNSEVVT
jgi:hypothetical protein